MSEVQTAAEDVPQHSDTEFFVGEEAQRPVATRPLTGKRCLVIEDHVHVARGIAQLLERAGADATLVGSLSEARVRLSSAVWDLIVVDLFLPDGDGADFAAEAARNLERVGIVIISGRVDYWTPADPHLVGAQFCHKAEAAHGLVPAALIAIVRAARLADTGVQSRASGFHVNPVAELVERFGLTRREREVFPLLIQGCGYKEIADRLCISASTAGRHAEEIYRRCGVTCQREFYAVVLRMIMERLRVLAPKSA